MPSQKAVGVKRSQSEPAVSSKRQRTEILVTSPVARVAPPPPPTYTLTRPTCTATSSTSVRKVELADEASDGSLTVITSHCPSQLALAVRASKNPGVIPIPVGRSKQVASASSSSADSMSTADSTTGDVDQLSLGVGPGETLEGAPDRSFLHQEDSPVMPVVSQQIPVACSPGMNHIVANLVPRREPASHGSVQSPSQQGAIATLSPGNLSDVKLGGWSDIQAGRVILDVGGTRYITSRSTLRTDPGSLLCAMVRQGSPMRPWRIEENNTPVYFLDRDPAHFRHVLNYLRLGNNWSVLSLPRELRYLYDLKAEVEHYQLTALKDLLENRISIVRDDFPQ